MLVGGWPGPVSVHTPDVCYAGNGFTTESQRKVSFSDTGPQFWLLRLKKQAAIPLQLSVFYAWSSGTTWKAADNPRIEFATEPALYKLYVVRERINDNDAELIESTRDLLKSLLPLLALDHTSKR